MRKILDALFVEALDDDIAAAVLAGIRAGMPEEDAIAEAIKLYAKVRRRQYKMLTRAAEIMGVAQWADMVDAGDR